MSRLRQEKKARPGLIREPSVFVCTPAPVCERGAAACAMEGQGCGGQQGMCCGYWLMAELWRHLLGRSHSWRRAEADQKKNVWFTEMRCSEFLASKQDLCWTSVFIIHFTFQTNVCFSNSLDKTQAVFVFCDLSEGWVFSSYCIVNNLLKQIRKWVFWQTYTYAIA